MNRFLTLLIILGLAVSACGGSTEVDVADPPDTVDWIAVTGTDPLLRFDADSYRQARTLVVSGPGAGDQAGTLVWTNEITSQPALRSTIGGDQQLRARLIEANGGVSALIVVDNDVWIADTDGTFTRLDDSGPANPLFGPYATIVGSMLAVVAPAGEAMVYVGAETVAGRDAWHYAGSDLGIALEQFDVPVVSVDAWVDVEHGVLLKARVITDTDDLTTRFELTYETSGFDEAISISPPG